MKNKFTLICYIFIAALLLPDTSKAQFFNYLPGMSNYINSDVKADPSGLLFSYRTQDTALQLKTFLIHTDNAGQVQWVKTPSSNFSSYTLAPDSSLILTGGRSTTSGNRIAVLQKLDRTGNAVWKKSLAASSADIGIGNIMIGVNKTIFATITRSSFSSSTYFSRAGVVAIDSNGVLLWTKYFSNSAQTTEYGFTRTLIAANGDFIGVADIRGSSGASANGMMITRISPLGIIRFSRYIDFKPTHTQLSVAGLVETASKNIVFGGRLMTDQISTYPNSMWLGKMDSAGTMIQQKVYSGGQDVGEQLHSLRYTNNKIFAFLHLYSPFDSVRKSLWMGDLDEQTLSFTAQNATELEVNSEDPYGNVSNSFCISSDGKPTVSAGFYCVAKSRYFPVMHQWSFNLASSCAALDAAQPLVDSITTYVVASYTPVGSFAFTYSTDVTVITFTNEALPVIANLCSGCATNTTSTPTGVKQVQQKGMFHIYPNPSDGLYHLDLDEPLQQVQMTVYNNLGAVVYETTIQSTQQLIDLREHAPGLYFVRLKMNDGPATTVKLIKK